MRLTNKMWSLKIASASQSEFGASPMDRSASCPDVRRAAIQALRDGRFISTGQENSKDAVRGEGTEFLVQCLQTDFYFRK
jgi:hypothetical protein